ncbi:MAG: M20/M25/M40 family metallo-hydrolase [Cyclobacteriaceae bacterium]|jgi:acetylornithine deacetylase/succinyl-diaminopimelate desuccinylase-like protein|nr:M20/M25/M40 family metallo-hydrolase [Cyclobacteriaceae bacterium]
MKNYFSLLIYSRAIVHAGLSMLFLCVSSSLVSQTLSHQDIGKSANKYLPKAISKLNEFLLLPNNSKSSDQINQNVTWCVEAMKQRSFETKILYSKDVPHVYAQRQYNAKLPWVLFYLQIDGQPVDSVNWDQKNPYEATLKKNVDGQWQSISWTQPNGYDPTWRIFARSVSDSKGPAMAFLSSLDILKELKVTPAFNIKIIMDFQEELGSPLLPQLVTANKDLLQAKMVLIMDGTRHVSNLPTLNFGARGIATIQLKVFGPRNDLHSGQYGNYAPNPVFTLAHLLAGMKDDSGRVLIPHYYDGVDLSEQELAMINEMPGDDAKLNHKLGIAKPDQIGHTYEESLQYPSLNIRGISAGSVEGEVRTIIPSQAIAELDLRLVPETDGERMVNLIKNYIADQGFHFVKDSPSEEERDTFSKLISFEYRIGSKPFRTDLNSWSGVWLSKAMDRTFGQGLYVKQRTTGGSQPIESFITTLNIPAVSLRFPNPDNNIHAANENLAIGSFVEGIQMCLGVLTQKMN